MTIFEFLRACREKYARVEVRYAHPTLYVIVVDEAFKKASTDARREALSTAIETTDAELTLLENASGISIELVCEEEFETDWILSCGIHFRLRPPSWSTLCIFTASKVDRHALLFLVYLRNSWRPRVTRFL
jgi:hypothetical protein